MICSFLNSDLSNSSSDVESAQIVVQKLLVQVIPLDGTIIIRFATLATNRGTKGWLVHVVIGHIDILHKKK